RQEKARLFFFSSRRRHTRWPRDWSSDVCSSDLGRQYLQAISLSGASAHNKLRSRLSRVRPRRCRAACRGRELCPEPKRVRLAWRSEERRVGKEGRYRGSPAHLEKYKAGPETRRK